MILAIHFIAALLPVFGDVEIDGRRYVYDSASRRLYLLRAAQRGVA